MKSRTSSCAPKPTANPTIPALARMGAMLILNFPSKISKKITHRNYRKSEVKVIYSTANIAFYVITNKLFENISFIQPKHIIYSPQTDGLSTPNA